MDSVNKKDEELAYLISFIGKKLNNSIITNIEYKPDGNTEKPYLVTLLNKETERFRYRGLKCKILM